MARLDLPTPVRMQRIALAVPDRNLRRVLVELGDGAAVELAGELPPPEGAANEALRRLDAGAAELKVTPAVSAEEPDLAALESDGARDLLAGEAELDRRRKLAITQDDVAVLVGWTPSDAVAKLRTLVARDGAGLVELPRPEEPPPTLLRSARLVGPFRVLVDTYGVLPYSDVDPTAFAAVAFVVMFGMMFGDVGHGALLILLGLALARTSRGRFVALRPAWPLLVAAGAAGSFFGLLYGEFFGPTHVIPSLWLVPLDEPLTLLRAAIAVGSVLLSISYLLGFANRWRERGSGAFYAEGGLAGGLVFAGIGITVLGWSRQAPWGIGAGVATAAVGLGLVFVGTFFQAGSGLSRVTTGLVEVMDVAIRIGSNIVSFTRLAAFGLMHAALSLVTLEAAARLAAGGALSWIGAGVVFMLGTLILLALEGMVASIQALRLEYYELFSRVFEEEGRPFTPFIIPVRHTEGPA